MMTECYVLHRGKISVEFNVENGLFQNCLLSSILFLFTIGDVLHAALSGGRGGVEWTVTFSLDYR